MPTRFWSCLYFHMLHGVQAEFSLEPGSQTLPTCFGAITCMCSNPLILCHMFPCDPFSNHLPSCERKYNDLVRGDAPHPRYHVLKCAFVLLCGKPFRVEDLIPPRDESVMEGAVPLSALQVALFTFKMHVPLIRPALLRTVETLSVVSNDLLLRLAKSNKFFSIFFSSLDDFEPVKVVFALCLHRTLSPQLCAKWCIPRAVLQFTYPAPNPQTRKLGLTLLSHCFSAVGPEFPDLNGVSEAYSELLKRMDDSDDNVCSFRLSCNDVFLFFPLCSPPSQVCPCQKRE